MNYENSIIQINVQKIDIDLNHPLNLFKNYETSGSGFFIDYNLILTCYHVVQEALDINVFILKNNIKIETKAKIKHIFPDDDLAIIEIIYTNYNYILLKYFIITNKDTISDANTIGYPLNSKNLIINKGIISGFQDSLIQTDSALNPGNSGGPLIINNEVVGVSQSKLGNATNTGFAIPIFRFLILWKLKKNQLQLINRKPNLYLKYQTIKQKDKHSVKNGVIITFIHDKSVLKNTKLSVGDYLLEICNHKIDHDGLIKFSFYPQKIELKNIHYWFTENDKLKIKFLSYKINTIVEEEIMFKVVKTNLIPLYIELNQKYYFENNGLIFSIITEYHMNNFEYLELNMKQKIKILNRCIDFKDLFTVYLSDIDFTKIKFKYYPVGDVIIEINDISFDNYDSFIKIINQPLKKIKTLNNEVYFI